MEDIQKNLGRLMNKQKKYLAFCKKRQLLSSKYDEIFLKVQAEKYRK